MSTAASDPTEPLPPRLLRQAVNYHLGLVDELRVVPGGAANLMLRVSTVAGPHMVRIYRQPDLGRFRHEILALRRLREANAPTPRLIMSSMCCPVLRLPILAYPALPGDTLTASLGKLTPQALSTVISNAIGAAVETAWRLPTDGHGYLHDSIHRKRPPVGVHHDPRTYEAIARKYELTPRPMLDRAIASAVANLDIVATDLPRLVHPDLKPENILVDGLHAYLIDWELAVGSHPMLAYGGLLAEGLAEPALSRALLDHLDGLSEAERRTAATAGLLRALEAVSYLPTHSQFELGRRVRRGASALNASIAILIEMVT